MKRVFALSLFLTALCLSPVSTAAQDAGKVGLVISTPTDVGIIWHVTDTIAIRPEINFNVGSTETEVDGIGSLDSSGRGFSFETSVLFGLSSTDSVHTYVSPRIGLAWDSTDEDGEESEEFSTTGTEVSLSYGARYAPISRFSIFGEVGLEYTRTKTTFEYASVVDFEVRSSGWGPRTEVGIILYLGGN